MPRRQAKNTDLPAYDRLIRTLADTDEAVGDFPQDLVESVLACRADFELFAERHLKLRSESGKVIPFTFRRAQRRIWRDHIKPDFDAGLPVFAYVLKARQLGISTFAEGALDWRSSCWADVTSMVTAHSTSSAQHLLRMAQRFYGWKSPDFRPSLKLGNRDELHYQNPDLEGDRGLDSYVMVKTARDQDLAASYTLQCAHLSEFARYDQNGLDVASLLATFLQAVPYIAGSMVLLETTAQGDNYARKFWYEDNGFKKIFLSWLADDKYSAALPLRESELSANPDGQFGDEVAARVSIQHELAVWYPEESVDPRWLALESLKRLAWRRDSIRQRCAGRLDLFWREYPTTPEEAFQTSARTIFDPIVLASERRRAEAEWLDREFNCERIEFPTPDVPVYVFDRGTAEHPPAVRTFERPKPGRVYVLGLDPGGGYTDGDPSGGQILRVDDDGTLTQVLAFHCALPAHRAARVAADLGRKYNTAFLIPEATGVGQATVDELYWHLNYPRVYRRRTFDDAEREFRDKIGFSTNHQTKPALIHQLQIAIADRRIRITDLETLSQLLQYRSDDKGHYGAAGTGHDDLVMALALAVEGARWIAGEKQYKKKAAPDYMSDAWWMKQIELARGLGSVGGTTRTY